MPRQLPVELKEFNAASLTGSPQNFGSVLLNPATKVSFVNSSTVDCYVDSAAPIAQRFRINAGMTLTLDESTLYFSGVDQEFYLRRGTQLTITQVSGAGVGSIIAHIVTRIIA